MENKINKNEEYIVKIIDTGFQGEGIAKINNFTVFIPDALKGEKIKILIVKVLASHAFGKILEIIKSSEFRVQADCQTYKRCGGCNLRHIKYDETLKIKQNAVQALVQKTLNQKIKVEETLGMKNPIYYRNKAEYPVGIDKNGKAVVGVFANRSHEIIPIKECFIQNKEAEQIAKEIEKFVNEKNISVYNEKTNKGLLRHIVIKVGIKTNQIMCILVLTKKELPQEKEFVKILINKFPNIQSIIKNINNKNTNVIMGNENIKVYGNEYIEDKLGELTFRISPLSFYQVNPIQAEKLYNIGIKSADIKKEDIVFDLYCGIGTISLFMAKYAYKVYGIEIVEEAVKAAKENAKINNIKNCEFFAGDTEFLLDDLINNKKIIPNVIMIDPPRRGIDNKTIENICKIKPKKVVYISCNPATLVRDLANLENCYKIKSIQPVDMFAYTSHVECVACLELKQN